MNYGRIMKYLRTSELISQKAMAEILGLKRSTYKEYELQNSIMPINHLNDFCNYFNCSIDYILGLTKNKVYKDLKKEINISLSSQRLKEIRLKNKLSQTDFAKKFNVDHSTISKYENGKNIISLSFLYQVNAKYGISIDYILGKTDKLVYLK